MIDNLTSDTTRPRWLLICPPQAWQEPIPIDIGELRLLELLGQRLNLVINRDDKRRKIYLGNALISEETEGASGLRFPSGWSAQIIDDE